MKMRRPCLCPSPFRTIVSRYQILLDDILSRLSRRDKQFTSTLSAVNYFPTRINLKLLVYRCAICFQYQKKQFRGILSPGV